MIPQECQQDFYHFLRKLIDSENESTFYKEQVWLVTRSIRHYSKIFKLVSGGEGKVADRWAMESEDLKVVLEQLKVDFDWAELPPLMRTISRSWNSETVTFEDFLRYMIPPIPNREQSILKYSSSFKEEFIQEQNREERRVRFKQEEDYEFNGRSFDLFLDGELSQAKLFKNDNPNLSDLKEMVLVPFKKVFACELKNLKDLRMYAQMVTMQPNFTKKGLIKLLDPRSKGYVIFSQISHFITKTGNQNLKNEDSTYLMQRLKISKKLKMFPSKFFEIFFENIDSFAFLKEQDYNFYIKKGKVRVQKLSKVSKFYGPLRMNKRKNVVFSLINYSKMKNSIKMSKRGGKYRPHSLSFNGRSTEKMEMKRNSSFQMTMVPNKRRVARRQMRVLTMGSQRGSPAKRTSNTFHKKNIFDQKSPIANRADSARKAWRAGKINGKTFQIRNQDSQGGHYHRQEFTMKEEEKRIAVAFKMITDSELYIEKIKRGVPLVAESLRYQFIDLIFGKREVLIIEDLCKNLREHLGLNFNMEDCKLLVKRSSKVEGGRISQSAIHYLLDYNSDYSSDTRYYYSGDDQTLFSRKTQGLVSDFFKALVAGETLISKILKNLERILRKREDDIFRIISASGGNCVRNDIGKKQFKEFLKRNDLRLSDQGVDVVFRRFSPCGDVISIKDFVSLFNN